MITRACSALALAVCCSSALASDIYRYRTPDGRIVFTDVPQKNVSTPQARAQTEVTAAEAELMQAYARLTAGFPPQPHELEPAPEDGKPNARRPKFIKTPEYHARIDVLKADVDRAQKVLDEARARFYASQPNASPVAAGPR